MRETEPDDVPDTQIVFGPCGIEPEERVLVVDGGHFGADEGPRRRPELVGDGLRGGESFVERDVALAGVEQGEARLGGGTPPGPTCASPT